MCLGSRFLLLGNVTLNPSPRIIFDRLAVGLTAGNWRWLHFLRVAGLLRAFCFNSWTAGLEKKGLCMSCLLQGTGTYKVAYTDCSCILLHMSGNL